MAKTFKTADLGGGFGALAGNADTLRGFVNSNPELLAQMGGQKGLENYITQHQQAMFHNSEAGGEYQFSPETRAIDELLKGYQMNSVGAAGIDDGRRKEIVKDGKTLYQGDAYSYKPAQENLETLLRGGALLGGAYAAFNPAGFLAGSGAGAGGASAAETAAIDAAMGGGLGGSTGAGGVFAGTGAEGIAALGGVTPSAGGSVNAALMEAMAGAPGYGSSGASLAAGIAPGVTAGQTAVNAAMNPYLNALGKISPELASAAGSASGGIGSVLGPVADAVLPASVLDKMGGGDGSSGGIFGSGGKDGKGGDKSWMDYILPTLAGYAAYKDAKKPQITGFTGSIKPQVAKQTTVQGKYGPTQKTSYAAGGIASAGTPRYLGSAHDGMEDTINAHIDGKEPAALSGGEFVIPADVVSHLGNGNSDAGAKQLFAMMDRIREARTGTTEQGKQIKPDRFMPV